MRYLVILLLLLTLACAAGQVKMFDTDRDQFEYARKLYREGNYTLAAEAFQTVIFRFHGTKLADSVAFYIGMSYFNNEDYILAVGEFKRLIANYPTSPLADQAMLMAGRSYFESAPDNIGLEQDELKDAVRTLENFQEDFPNSAFRQNAREILDSCYGRMAHKDYQNGETYFRIGDLRAARIYFEDVVTTYQIPKWRAKALYRLAEIDIKQKEFSDARDKLKNFLNAFPDHEWAEKARGKLADMEKKINEQKQEQFSDE